MRRNSCSIFSEIVFNFVTMFVGGVKINNYTHPSSCLDVYISNNYKEKKVAIGFLTMLFAQFDIIIVSGMM